MGLFGRKKKGQGGFAKGKTASGLVSFDGDRIRANVKSASEAKMAIKELRVMKKALSADKKAVASRLSEIRAQRQVKLGKRGSMMRGGKGLGRFVRSVQSASRDSERASHATAVAPYEEEKTRIERKMIAIDQMIAKLEAHSIQYE
ncbi:MAG: hypothetical protein QOJ59_5600 [Thermomicrobiales bacterium]|nr:hypothetical protein [Thermomicrobiales bacterium]